MDKEIQQSALIDYTTGMGMEVRRGYYLLRHFCTVSPITLKTHAHFMSNKINKNKIFKLMNTCHKKKTTTNNNEEYFNLH